MRLFKKAARVSVGLVLGVLACEAIFYFHPVRDLWSDRYRMSFFENTPPFWVADRWRTDHPAVGIHQRPNWYGDLIYAHGTVHYRTNRDGFRFPDLPYEKPSGKRRIAFYGNSVLLSKEIPEDVTLTARVQRSLRERGMDVDCLNFGVENTGIMHWVLNHRHFGTPYHPDIVVFVDPTAYAEARILKRVPGSARIELISSLTGQPYSAFLNFRQGLGIKSRLYLVQWRIKSEFAYHNLLDDLLVNWRGRRTRVASPEVEIANAKEEASRYIIALQLFAKQARQEGVKKVVVLWIRAPRTWVRPHRDRLVFSEVNQSLSTTPIEGLELLDARPLLEGRPDALWYLERLNHFHAEGTAELSAWLAPQLAALLSAPDDTKMVADRSDSMRKR